MAGRKQGGREGERKMEGGTEKAFDEDNNCRVLNATGRANNESGTPEDDAVVVVMVVL